MSVNSTHPDYDASLPAWLRARDVIAGEDAVKSAGEKYLPRLEAQTDDEYDAYRARASLFNATARTADGYLGLLFRQAPFIKVPEAGNAIGKGEAIGLSLHRCVLAIEGIAAYGLFDEKNRLADPAIEYCAPLDWTEKWRSQFRTILSDYICCWIRAHRFRVPHTTESFPITLHWGWRRMRLESHGSSRRN